MQFDCSKDVSVHVSTAPVKISKHWRQLCGSCGPDKMCVFLSLIAKICDQLLEQ